MDRIGVWGDSITWGACDHEMGGWVARLRHYIDNTHKDGPSVYNVGVSGDKVNDVLKRFDIEYEARKPEVIILAIGINDAPHDNYPKGTPLEIFEQEFAELVSKAMARSRNLLVVGLTSVDGNHPDAHGYKNEAIKLYDEIVKKVSGQSQLPYIDVFDLIALDDLKLDGLHPEAEGHEKIFQKVKQELGRQGILD